LSELTTIWTAALFAPFLRYIRRQFRRRIFWIFALIFLGKLLFEGLLLLFVNATPAVVDFVRANLLRCLGRTFRIALVLDLGRDQPELIAVLFGEFPA